MVRMLLFYIFWSIGSMPLYFCVQTRRVPFRFCCDGANWWRPSYKGFALISALYVAADGPNLESFGLQPISANVLIAARTLAKERLALWA